MRKFKKFTDEELTIIWETLDMALFNIETNPIVHNKKDLAFLARTKKKAKSLCKQIDKEEIKRLRKTLDANTVTVLHGKTIIGKDK